MDRGRRENRAEGVNDIIIERRDRTDLVFEMLICDTPTRCYGAWVHPNSSIVTGLLAQ